MSRQNQTYYLTKEFLKKINSYNFVDNFIHFKGGQSDATATDVTQAFTNMKDNLWLELDEFTPEEVDLLAPYLQRHHDNNLSLNRLSPDTVKRLIEVLKKAEKEMQTLSLRNLRPDVISLIFDNWAALDFYSLYLHDDIPESHLPQLIEVFTHKPLRIIFGPHCSYKFLESVYNQLKTSDACIPQGSQLLAKKNKGQANPWYPKLREVFDARISDRPSKRQKTAKESKSEEIASAGAAAAASTNGSLGAAAAASPAPMQVAPSPSLPTPFLAQFSTPPQTYLLIHSPQPRQAMPHTFPFRLSPPPMQRTISLDRSRDPRLQLSSAAATAPTAAANAANFSPFPLLSPAASVPVSPPLPDAEMSSAAAASHTPQPAPMNPDNNASPQAAAAAAASNKHSGKKRKHVSAEKYNTQKAEAQLAKAKLREDANIFKAKIDKLRAENEGLHAKCAGYKGHMDSLTQQLQTEQSQRANSQHQVAALQQQLQAQQVAMQSFENLSQQLAATQSQLTEAQTRCNALLSSSEGTHQELLNVQQQLSGTLQTIDKQARELAAAQQTNASLAAQIASSQKRTSSFEDFLRSGMSLLSPPQAAAPAAPESAAAAAASTPMKLEPTT